MQLGILAKTFETLGAEATLRAVRSAGFTVAQFNMACLGLPPMPDVIDPEDAARVAAASKATGVGIVAVTGTYNMVHPDLSVRRAGLRRLEVLAAACASMSTQVITLCTGTRDVEDQWQWHPDNSAPEAWRDLIVEMAAAVDIAERYDVTLGIEPELANVVSSADLARRIIDELGSPRLRVVLDPANLFEVAEAGQRRAVIEHAVEVLADSIVLAHAKDRRASGDFTVAGQGVIDFRHFVETLRLAGFDGPLVTHGLTAAEAAGVAQFLTAILVEAGAA